MLLHSPSLKLAQRPLDLWVQVESVEVAWPVHPCVLSLSHVLYLLSPADARVEACAKRRWVNSGAVG